MDKEKITQAPADEEPTIEVPKEKLKKVVGGKGFDDIPTVPENDYNDDIRKKASGEQN